MRARFRSLNAIAFALLLCGSTCYQLHAEELPAEQPPAAKTEVKTDTPKSETVLATATNHAVRVAANFIALMGSAWNETLAFAGRLMLAVVLGSIAGFLLTGLLGLLLWYAIRRFGAFDAAWKWYRYARWTWPVVFFLLPAAGGSYGGAWVGGGRCLKKAVIEERVLDRIVMHLYCAIALDQADYEVKGAETMDALELALKESESGHRVVEQDFEQALQDLVDEKHQSLWTFVLVKLSNGFVSRELVEAMDGLDPRALVILFLQHPNIDDYVKEHPNAQPALMALASQFTAARELAGRSIDSAVTVHLLIGAGLGLLAPLGCWGLFLLTRYYTKARPLPKIVVPAAPDAQT